MFRKLDFKPRLSYCYENITDGYSSGQRGKTVNLLPLGFESSNLSPSTVYFAKIAQLVERLFEAQKVIGSKPILRTLKNTRDYLYELIQYKHKQF